MDSKTPLTNEAIAKKFRNNFDMVLYAIKGAESMIRSGRGPRIRTNTENKAMIMIEEIAAGRDHLNDVGITSEGFTTDFDDEMFEEVYVLEDEHKEKMVIMEAEG